MIKTIRYIQRDPVPAILWEEPMQYSGLFQPGDEICQDGAWYKVLAVEVRDEIQDVTLEPVPSEPKSIVAPDVQKTGMALVMDVHDGSSIRNLLASYRYSFQSETELQEGIARALTPVIDFEKEYSLDKTDRPDFFLPSIGVVIEVKVRFSRSEVLRQLHRYTQYEQVRSLILVTRKSCHSIPEYINSKRIYVVNVGRL